MELYPSGLLALGLWAIAAWRSADQAFAFCILMIPFGMFAVMRLPIGGLTPLAAHVTAALTIVLLVVGMLVRRDSASGTIPSAALPLLLLGVYALFSATVLVRYYAGEMSVFSFERGAGGTRVSSLFRAKLSPLRPNPANLSQTAYLLLSIAFFVVAADVVRRRGLDFVIRALRWAASINIVLGFIDYFGMDALLAPFQTASYSLLNTSAIAGVPRAIGGFPEASSFGALSAALCGFFLTYGHARGRLPDLLIGAGCGIFAVLSLSSTAFVGLGAVGLFFLVRALRPFVVSIDQREAYAVIAGGCGALALVALVIASDVFGDLPLQIFDKLFLSKAESESGLERGTMALYGMRTFLETNGLGAGVGSVRANGLLSAMLASVGLPGLLLFVWFLKSAVIDGDAGREGELKAARRAAQAGVFASIMVNLTSSFMVDPGLLTMVFAAIAVGARLPKRQVARATA